MHKISWEALIAWFAPILDVGLIQFTCASNSVKNSLIFYCLTILLKSWVLYSTHSAKRALIDRRILSLNL